MTEGRAQIRGDEFDQLRTEHSPVPWEPPARNPEDATTDRVWIGPDPHGLGFEVAVASWAGSNAPPHEALRALHSARLRNRAVPLCVAVRDARGNAWILGPVATAPSLGPIPIGQAVRILQAALDERSGSAARARILRTRDALETAEIPGFDSQGLFAIRELTYGVPRRPDWAPACERSRRLLAQSPRGNDLIRGLGFGSHSVPGNALLLTVGAERPRAVAILLRDDESFEAESPRFSRSPIYHGLEIARQNNVEWLVVARGPQLRLYPTSPDVGVGRRGATQTYFGLDLALLDDDHAGYLDLAFSAGALAPNGSVDQLLEASRDYAVSLGSGYGSGSTTTSWTRYPPPLRHPWHETRSSTRPDLPLRTDSRFGFCSASCSKHMPRTRVSCRCIETLDTRLSRSRNSLGTLLSTRTDLMILEVRHCGTACSKSGE